MKILLIEDNTDIAELIFDYFENLGVTLDFASNGLQGFELASHASKQSYDCIVLDIMLPGIDGLTLCRKLRDEGNNTPIIMLTARDTNKDIIDGFDIGADDYLVKPFDLEVLEARISALVRRAGGMGFQKTLALGPLFIDIQKRQVKRNDTLLKLNPTCYDIMFLLMQKFPQPISKRDIEWHIWGDDPPEEDIIRKHIYHLRSAVDKPFETPVIKTLPKVGYILEIDE